VVGDIVDQPGRPVDVRDGLDTPVFRHTEDELAAICVGECWGISSLNSVWRFSQSAIRSLSSLVVISLIVTVKFGFRRLVYLA